MSMALACPRGNLPRLIGSDGSQLSRRTVASVQGSEIPQSEEGRYRLLVDAITDYAIYMLDADGRVTNWNSGAQRFKGYRADEIIGEHFSRFYTEHDRENGLPARALAIARTEGKFESEGWRVRKDGTPFWAHVVIDPIRGSDGTLLGYAKITRDLSERREAEQALKRSEEQFRLLVQSVTDYAIYMLDPKGHVTSWNPGAHRIKGYTSEEIIGTHFSQFYTEEDRANGMPARALKIAEEEGRFSIEAWRVRKDGSHFWASVVIDPIRQEDGKLIGFAKVTRDLTERENAQRELDRAREALFQAQKMEAIGQLTGGVAHDFNNLLMATLGSLELLRKRVGHDAQALKLLENAMAGAQRGATLTQRMLAFARRQDLNPVPVDIPELVEGMKDLIARAIEPTIDAEIEFPAHLDRVTADANQLEMALLNLVVNARDAMPDGGTLKISADVHELGQGDATKLAPGRYVRLSVADTGTGMDAETLQRATEPFFTTKGVGKGTGLGLPMVQGLADQLGGVLKVESELGVGTVVSLWLPATRAEAQPSAAPAETVESIEADQPLKILAVDDDGLVLMNTVALLEDLGHVVVEAYSAEEALVEFERDEDIDLVITDQAMPGMTGLQLAETLREKRADMPVIVATGYGELPEDPERKFHKLQKPFRQADLARAVGAVMQTLDQG